ncbi:hypothetical protein [Pelagicoccus mobilis]|uniref:Uncharacterized protein n=1 Tax=Pelagicoccus mobilis TaxID=415221 RepID=A0A934RZA8_9BACT|nr:hypothetical protein [Pelagicoccus mobilis]MBK1877621.1 hypothetical protein [Pelagicoccus mobilis]
MNNSNKRFYARFGGSWGSFGIFALLAYGLELYSYLPFFGLLGYATMILLLLLALSEAEVRLHYLLVSGSLMIFGAFASFDLVSSRDELTTIWKEWLGEDITNEQSSGLVQALLILLGIFCGSLASATLFYGLNKKNFRG